MKGDLRMLRCAMCGKPAGDDPDARSLERRAEEQAKAAGPVKRPVWICPLCAGRTRHEAEEGGKGLRRKE